MRRLCSMMARCSRGEVGTVDSWDTDQLRTPFFPRRHAPSPVPHEGLSLLLLLSQSGNDDSINHLTYFVKSNMRFLTRPEPFPKYFCCKRRIKSHRLTNFFFPPALLLPHVRFAAGGGKSMLSLFQQADTTRWYSPPRALSGLLVTAETVSVSHLL